MFYRLDVRLENDRFVFPDGVQTPIGEYKKFETSEYVFYFSSIYPPVVSEKPGTAYYFYNELPSTTADIFLSPSGSYVAQVWETWGRVTNAKRMGKFPVSIDVEESVKAGNLAFRIISPKKDETVWQKINPKKISLKKLRFK